jgi:hypothetical protein
MIYQYGDLTVDWLTVSSGKDPVRLAEILPFAVSTGNVSAYGRNFFWKEAAGT